MPSRYRSRIWRAVIPALAAAALTACAGLDLPPPSPASPPSPQPACCVVVAALPFAAIVPGTETRLDIDAATSPVVDLPGGRSPVAALRLPDGPRPLVLDLVSRQLAPPESAQDPLGALLGLSRRARPGIDAMNPTVWIVDAGHGLVREIAATAVTEPCDLANLKRSSPLVQLRATIDEPPDRAAYLIVGTSDRQRAAPKPKRCTGVDLRFGDRGRIELTLRSAAPAEPGAAQAAASWSREAGVGPALAPPLQRGRLLVGTQGVAYDQPERGRLVRVLDLPADALVGVHGSAGVPNMLSISSVEGSAATLRRDRFALPTEAPAGDAGLDDLVARLQAQIRPGRYIQTVAFSVPPWSVEPRVRFESTAQASAAKAPTAESDGALHRIGQEAAAAGVVTAAPCGLCAMGGCGPAMLAPCAALFSVGAAIGGIWSAGKELLGGGRRSSTPAAVNPAPAPAAAASAAPAASAPVVAPAALVAGFDRAALEACVERAVTEADPDLWGDQGRSARVQLVRPSPEGDAGHAAAGVRLLVEPRVAAIELFVVGAAGHATPTPDADARLQVKVTLRAVDLASREEWTPSFSWNGRWQPLSAWAEAAPADVGRELAEACRNIAVASKALGARRWRDLR